MANARSIATRFVLFISSLLITLLGVEALLRTGALAGKNVRRTMVEDRPRSRMDRPDFRQPDFEVEDKHGAFRILVLGDSFSWGDGVYREDTFAHRLETRLNSLTQEPSFEVVNWSRPGWNTVRQVRSIQPEFAALDADLLILAFVLNDPEPVERSRLEQMLESARSRQPAPGVSSWLFEHSRLYALVWNRFENSRTHRELSAFYRSLFAGEHWEACQRALKRLRNLSRKQGVPMLLVIFPVFDSPMDGSYPYADLHAQIAKEGERLQIQVLDLFELYEGMDTRRLAVVPFTNAHPSELAHRVAADGILDYLVRSKLVPIVKDPPRRRQRQPGG